MLFLLAYWYLYIDAWFCAILTCLLVLVYIRLVLCYFYLRISILSIYTPGFVLFLLAYWYLVYIYAWFCAILTCILVLVYIYAWFCAIFTCVLVYLVYIRLVLCCSYLPIGT